ncbi:MAG: hypothetical protein RSA10_02315 [Bacilli bacterium]
MKNLVAAVTYSFNDFYDRLNVQGQMIFSSIVILIFILCFLLFLAYIMQEIKSKKRIKAIKKLPMQNKTYEENKKSTDLNAKTNIENIAKSIETSLEKEAPVELTNFEDDQEKTAIISINELFEKADELSTFDDEYDEGMRVNYLEKFNLASPLIDEALNETKQEQSAPVKAFKVSQVISPIYGVKKEVIDNNR